MQLTDEQVQAAQQQGFLCVPRITSDEEALTIRASLERLFRDRVGWNEGAYGELATSGDVDEEPNSPQILHPANYAPDLHKTECFANALRFAKQILGERAAFFFDLTILKRAESGEPTPWHQDEAFRDPNFEYREVTVWVALRDVDESSGCLVFVPESHRRQILEHQQMTGTGESIALECIGPFDKATAVKAEIPLGGCTIHFSRTLHCSTPNTSGTPRIVYIMTFGTAPVPVKTAVSFPWRDNTVTEMQVRRRKWMRHGGVFVTAWRRVRRGNLKDWLAYLGVRAIRSFMRGR
jgi:ectoine hydroxylase-related dioxygenase (phytanoyl-CoA dioxygenase family)